MTTASPPISRQRGDQVPSRSIVVAVGNHRAMQRKQHHVDRHGVTQVFEDFVAKTFIRWSAPSVLLGWATAIRPSRDLASRAPPPSAFQMCSAAVQYLQAASMSRRRA